MNQELLEKTCNTVNTTCTLVVTYLVLKFVWVLFEYTVAMGSYSGEAY